MGDGSVQINDAVRILRFVVGLVPLGEMTGETPTYVGSERCAACHSAAYQDEAKSGHPNKLRKVMDGQPPAYPFSEVPSPPEGYTWQNITYVIGGYGWKARFIDEKGYVITGEKTQYNLATKQWVAYEAEVAPGTKPYDCGQCHTAGWRKTGPEAPHQDGLPGIYGTFAEPGVTCEACHGPGSRHVFTKSGRDITKDSSSELCGTCHFRDGKHRIQASVKDGKGFIQHHEQYDEMVSAGHKALTCVTCHDPHKSTLYKQGGLKDSPKCETCHPSQAAKVNHPPTAVCVDCHMPKASKTAVTTPGNPYQADLRTHIFRINADPVGQSAMWYTEDGKAFAKGFVTLDFACYGCHKDASGQGGPMSVKTLEQLSAKAKQMHQ
ncbi:MAG: multiheme c-type cytochrome [Armatimonadota bacterium]